MRRRLETLLEKSLIEKGYKLVCKTYEGKRSEKVDTFVYKKDNGTIEYQVCLDNKREHIRHYSFTNKCQMEYTSGILESLERINAHFIKELEEVYDFENGCGMELEKQDLQRWKEEEELAMSEPFIEESNFDD